VGDHVASEARTEEGLFFAVLTSNAISMFSVVDSCKNVLIDDGSQDGDCGMRRY